MANPNQLYNLRPLTNADLALASKVVTNTDPHCPPEDILRLQVDVINVFEGRVDIASFDPAYQERIKNYYKFSATQHLSSQPVIAKRTTDTLDLV